MGTSSRYTAPTGGDWTRAKTRMTNWTRGGGQNGDLASAALGAFVTALGGAASAAATATGGVSGAAGLGEFLTDVSREGLDATLDRYELADVVGAEPLEVINEIAGRISGAGDSVEESVGRQAVLEVLSELYADADTFEEMDAVAVDADLLRDFLARFLTEYIYRRVLQALGDRIRDNAASEAEAARLEQQLRDHIRALVDLDLSTIDPLRLNWRGAEGRRRMEELLADAFRMASAGE
jgi:hypothetical protein